MTSTPKSLVMRLLALATSTRCSTLDWPTVFRRQIRPVPHCHLPRSRTAKATSRASASGANTRPHSIMWWRFVWGPRQLRFGFSEAFGKSGELARHRVDLGPLLGDGFVQGLDRIVLKRHAHFKSVNAIGKSLRIRSVKVVHCSHFPFHVPASHGRARRACR